MRGDHAHPKPAKEIRFQGGKCALRVVYRESTLLNELMDVPWVFSWSMIIRGSDTSKGLGPFIIGIVNELGSEE